MKNILKRFSVGELALWCSSVMLIVVFFLIFDRSSYLSLAASLIGVTSLIFCAKGDPIGQVLMIVFSLLYGFISLTFSYYGEMITYLGMSLPMAVFSLVSWVKNPYKGNKSEVKVSRLSLRAVTVISLLAVAVTVAFYFILGAFDTANLIPSTLSVATSFLAAALTFKRSPWYALAYAMNDVVLIVLWSLAMLSDPSYISVTVCFAVFLVNDLYGFVNWRRMAKRQQRLDGADGEG